MSKLLYTCVKFLNTLISHFLQKKYLTLTPATKRDTSLLYVDLPPTVGQAPNPQWCPLIEAGFQVTNTSTQLTTLPLQQPQPHTST